MNSFGKGKYEGETVEGWYHGKGSFKYDNGVVYEGGFNKGQFHGDGILIYPKGSKFVGKWQNGIQMEGDFIFEDGLSFREPAKWDFCTYKDRRFYHEVLHDVKSSDVDKYNDRLYKQIPEGSYDTGDGFYDSEKGTIFSHENQFLRIPNEEEVNILFYFQEEWIKLKCRYNPKKDELDDFNEENLEKKDHVIQNIIREFKFRKYVKNK